MFQSSVRVLSQSDMDLIHSSAKDILISVGVRVDHERMRALLSEAGCRVDGSVVRFSDQLIEMVVEKMRDPAYLDDGYIGTLPLHRDRLPPDAKVIPITTGQATVANDLDTNDLRPATQRDLAAACKVTSALEGSVTGHPMFIPQDVPEMVRDLYALKTVAENYPYSDFVEIYSPEVVPYFLEMGRVICGTDEALKDNPPFTSWAFATPPLQFGKHGFEIVFKLKDFGLKKGFGVGGVMPILGASTPLTLAGYLAIQTAEILACNTMDWCILGRVVGYVAGPAILDMKFTSPSQSAPEAILLLIACMDLQRYYGEKEPIFPYALGADAKIPDIQAGIDKAFSAVVAVLAGSRVLSAGMGTLNLSGIGSLAQLVIDYELCKSLDHMLKGFIVDREHIGLDLIKEIGIGGSFLAEEHTLKHMRETLFFPKLFDRRLAGSWQEDRKGMLELAVDYVHKIMNTESQPYLTGEQTRELNRIAKTASNALS